MFRFAMLLMLFNAPLVGGAAERDPSQRFVYPVQGKLVYDRNERGDRVPDFSYCGYGGGGTALPEVEAVIEVGPIAGDNTAHLQSAIDRVAAATAVGDKSRGAVQLKPGRYDISGTLRLNGKGIVLRGAGSSEAGTTLFATGIARRAVVCCEQVRARPAARRGTPAALPPISFDIEGLVPVGSLVVQVGGKSVLHVGDHIRIDHPGTKEWIRAVDMDRFPSRDLKGSWLDWKPNTINLCWHRTIVAIDGASLMLDAPITSALDPALAQATLSPDERFLPAAAAGRRPSEQIGIEDLRIESEFASHNSKDEDHAWDAIRLNDVEDAWVRNVTCQHFAGSAVAVWEHARRVTVVDCTSLAPVSEDGGWRRHTFYTAGQQTLFLRCRADSGRHDFAVGHLTAGPNAFVDCTATHAGQFSGPIGSWACGVLYDNVEIDGAGLSLTNRETAAQGTGWSAANCVLWNCTAPLVTCRRPPTAQNWAIGIWGEVVGDGHWRQLNEYSAPQSLYRAQLNDRLGLDAAERALRSTSEEQRRERRAPASLVPMHPAAALDASLPPALPPLRVTNGWLTFGDNLAAGGRINPTWWRGSVVPTKVDEFGPGLTRFVPGREGAGYTDNLADLTDQMMTENRVALEHHWGLWYDRRRDDHQMLRRADGDVWPPFDEQPWARSGRGQAWDGLSQYDLTRFNPWYFARLKEFADHCDRKGLVLIQQMYFQHNVLEAGAHWADFPWRPANCLQATGFPEPPPYENRKRVFMAEAFYDVTHPVRRDLHRAYIRHCLDVLGANSNVIFLIGEEYTGPLHFVRFWLETIADWQREHQRDLLIGLSCTKDVQDAVLEDAALAPLIDVIDLKYWWYTSSGTVFAPSGGSDLAPRQQVREWSGSTARTEAEAARAIWEYRQRYPDKAVICSLSGTNPWSVVTAGGSLPALPGSVATELLRAIPTMKALREAQPSGASYFLLSSRGDRLGAPLRGADARAAETPEHRPPSRRIAVDVRTGRFVESSDAAPPPSGDLSSPGSVEYWLRGP